MEIKYDNLRIGEDTALIERLLSKNNLFLINNVPNLYIYIYHGKNTWNYSHWAKIFECSFHLNTCDSSKIQDLLKDNENIINNSLTLDKLLSIPIFEK